MENTGLYTARRMNDGEPITGYLLRYGRLFTFIVEKDYFNNMCIGSKNEEIVSLTLVRVIDGTETPVPSDMEEVK